MGSTTAYLSSCCFVQHTKDLSRLNEGWIWPNPKDPGFLSLFPTHKGNQIKPTLQRMTLLIKQASTKFITVSSLKDAEHSFDKCRYLFSLGVAVVVVVVVVVDVSSYVNQTNTDWHRVTISFSRSVSIPPPWLLKPLLFLPLNTHAQSPTLSLSLSLTLPKTLAHTNTNTHAHQSLPDWLFQPQRFHSLD